MASYVLPTGGGNQSGDNWRYSDTDFRYGDQDRLKDDSPYSSCATFSSNEMPCAPSSSSYLTSSVQDIHQKQTTTMPLLTSDNNVNSNNTNLTTDCKTTTSICSEDDQVNGEFPNERKLNVGPKSNFSDNNINTNLTVNCIKQKEINNNIPLHLSLYKTDVIEGDKIHSDPIENICSCLGNEMGETNEKMECLCSCNSNSEFSVESLTTTSSSSTSTSTATPSQLDCIDTLPLNRAQRTILELAEIGLIHSFDFQDDTRNGKILKNEKILYIDMKSADYCGSNSTYINIDDNIIKQTREETDIETETEMEVILEDTIPTINLSRVSHKFECNRQDDDINLSIRYLVRKFYSPILITILFFS